MVAAWISADTGVGPSIASGSHTYSGICALLPVQPRNSISVAKVITAPPVANTAGATANSRSYCRLPPHANSVNMPSSTPKSPMRLTMNAFFPASAADGLWYQNPISR